MDGRQRSACSTNGGLHKQVTSTVCTPSPLGLRHLQQEGWNSSMETFFAQDDVHNSVVITVGWALVAGVTSPRRCRRLVLKNGTTLERMNGINGEALWACMMFTIGLSLVGRAVHGPPGHPCWWAIQGPLKAPAHWRKGGMPGPGLAEQPGPVHGRPGTLHR